jgi:hypothetical protein
MKARAKLVLLWAMCAAFSGVLLLAMLAQALFGSEARALNMAIAYDECANALFGDDPKVTISERTGNALIAGKRWAKLAAPCIDFIFGPGHCLAHATTPH